MSGPSFTVDLDGVQDLVDQMAAVESKLSDQLADIERQIAGLQLTWTGDAAAAQLSAHLRWKAGAQQMQQALTDLRRAATTAHGNYSAAVSSNLAMWE